MGGPCIQTIIIDKQLVVCEGGDPKPNNVVDYFVSNEDPDMNALCVRYLLDLRI